MTEGADATYARLLRERDELVLKDFELRLKNERQFAGILLAQVRGLRDDIHWWKIAFSIVTVQFAVMFVAALWGWTR